MITDFLKRLKWSLTVEKSFEWNPASYNIGGALAAIDGTQLLSLEDAFNPRKKLQKLQTIIKPRSKVSVSLLWSTLVLRLSSIRLSRYWQTRYTKMLEESRLSDEKKQSFKKTLASADMAVKAYVDFLKSLEVELEKNGARSFRMEGELYRQKFAMSLQPS